MSFSRGVARVNAIILLIIIAAALPLTAIAIIPLSSPEDSREPATNTVITINGAGSTFAFPLLSRMTIEYNRINPSVRINYQSIGSGGGIRQHVAKTVDFAVTDAPLTAKQRESAPDTLNIPITIGAIALVYNIPGIGSGLKLTSSMIAKIFLGSLRSIDDDSIAKLNPGLNLPSKDFVIIHRSDGSGTTFVFTQYLSLVSKEWDRRIGAGTAVSWPLGLGAAGNEGVAGLVRSTPYSIGYVELAYAIQNRMSYANIENPSGRFVEPSLESSKAAAEAMAEYLPKGYESWERVSLLNSPGEKSYPIVSFSYVILYSDLSKIPGMNKAKAKALVDFLWWAINDGQTYAPSLQYVPLPKNVVSLNEETLRLVTFRGEALLDKGIK